MSGPATLVVGGGLAGAAVAIRLAAAGARPLVIERSVGAHDKVCGEFLSSEAVDELRALGVDPADHDAVPIGEVRLWHGARAARARLPFTALSLSRRVLDEALLERAAAAGAVIERGSRMGELPEAPAGGLFVATGKAPMRGIERGVPSGLTGLKMHYRADAGTVAALSGAVEIVLTRCGYAGVQLVEGGVVNLCLLTRAPGPGAIERIVAETPRLAQLLAGAEPLWSKPLAVSALPYGFVAAPEPDAGRRFRLGDQAAMIHSFTGDGMALALTSARWAAEAWARDGAGGAAAYARRLRSGARRPVGTAQLAARLGLRHGALAVALARAVPGLPAALARATRVRFVAG